MRPALVFVAGVALLAVRLGAPYLPDVAVVATPVGALAGVTFARLLRRRDVLLVAVAARGLLRLPDASSRMNAVTKAASLGVVLVLAGAAFPAPSWLAVVGVLVAIALQLVTAPVGGFALGRASYRAGTPLARATRYDELGDAIERPGATRPVAAPAPPDRPERPPLRPPGGPPPPPPPSRAPGRPW